MSSLWPQLKKLLPSSIIGDAAIDEAVKQWGNADAAAQSLVSTATEHLEQQTPEYLAIERRTLIAQLLHDSLPARPERLATREAALLEKVRELTDTDGREGEYETEIQALEGEVDFYRKRGEPGAARSVARRLIRVRLEQELYPTLAALYQQLAAVSGELATSAGADLIALTRLRAELVSRQNGLQPSRHAVDLTNREEWLVAPGVLAQLARQRVRPLLKSPIGDLATRNPAELANGLEGALVPVIPTPAGLGSPAVASQVVEGLSQIDGWSGVSRKERDPWRIAPPRAVIQAPRTLVLPPRPVPQCETVRQEGPDHEVVVRVFKILPLAAVEGWSRWGEADAAIVKKYDGFPVNTAEPDQVREHERLVDAFAGVTDGWKGNQNGAAPERRPVGVGASGWLDIP